MQDAKGKENANPHTKESIKTNGQTEAIESYITNEQTEANEIIKINGHTETNGNSKLNDSIQSYAKVWFFICKNHWTKDGNTKNFVIFLIG